MSLARQSALVSIIAIISVSAPAPFSAFQSDRIVGYVTGGKLGTTNLIIRRPPLGSGTVTKAASRYAASGNWTETGHFNGSYPYKVTVKAEGGWSPFTKQMTEKVAVIIDGYKDLPINGTWAFESTGSCSQDPWRFPVTCTGIQQSISRPTGGPVDALMPAVPYPLSAAGRLTDAEISVVSLAEVVVPEMNQSFNNPASVQVKVLVHPANILNKDGNLKIEIRPYGAADFPSAALSKEYLGKTVPGALGVTSETTFDLSGHVTKDWQIAGTFAKGWAAGKRSAWVRFNAMPKVMHSPSAIQTFEGESLAATASSPVTVQPMQQFGSSWGGNAHLWWGANGTGDTLTVTLDLPAAGLFAVELYMTRGPDFGNVEVTLSGQSPALNFSGYAPTVFWSGPIQMGKFQLPAGQHTIKFRVTGKYPASKGYRVGFDRLRLYPG